MALARKVLHLCRVDHVMGLFRIYAFPWPPQRNAEFLPLSQEEAAAKTGGRLPGFRPFADDTPEHVAANQRQGEETLKILLDSADGMTVVAEDLGVVPAYVRSTLDALGIAGFRVPSFCREADGSYSDPSAYPRLSVTQPATHDHPPFAAAWAERWRDINLGRNVSENQHELRRLMHFAGLKGEPPRHFTAGLHEAVLRATLRPIPGSPCSCSTMCSQARNASTPPAPSLRTTGPPAPLTRSPKWITTQISSPKRRPSRA